MKAAVTGASGFVGRILCDFLRESGDVVLELSRSAHPGFDVLDPKSLQDALAGSGAEVLYHLAARSNAGESFGRAAATLRVNVEGSLNVLNAAHTAGIQRVLVVGSAEEYGARGDRNPLGEDSPPRPLTPYGVSKLAAGYLGLQMHLSTGLGTIMTRSFNHTGPGQSDRFLVPAIAARIAEAERSGDPEVAIGRTDSTREINDVRDVVQAYRLLLLHGEEGATYNVCSGREYTVEEIALKLLGLSSRRLTLRQDPGLVRPLEPSWLVGDPRKLQAATGWRPRFTPEQTLEDVLQEARRAATKQSTA